MSSESLCQVARSWMEVGSFHTRLVVRFMIFTASVRNIWDTHSFLYHVGLRSGRKKTCRPRWCSGDSSSRRNSWFWGSIGFISAMCVLTRMEIIFNGVNSLTCHRPRTGFGWISLELHVELPTKILCAFLSCPMYAVCHMYLISLLDDINCEAPLY
jgi:hypothetical protein